MSHGLEYEVKHQMHRSWVSAERMLPPQSALHVGSHNAHLAQDGCLVSGQVMRTPNPNPNPNPNPSPNPNPNPNPSPNRNPNQAA